MIQNLYKTDVSALAWVNRILMTILFEENKYCI